ncbi:lysylphosphatidylglycerol synthase transmembrane domain-containing protein [Streptomonospora nanhaiensis]|uniref:lysylphosphatidylglycerol synthase transmembrane domain-containing protein n=1 Tax=Streptomonospora nanhaiensis TaxID=1323731 RepID=UPI001C381083|nr:lysylphosphatidylglycerol synthase transmembrane domain-containing protein [Streptomonospora nanhaiensis]MBV2363418.1 flippase-like domain-containing protein [Streptomonospora nanhaiensis]
MSARVRAWSRLVISAGIVALLAWRLGDDALRAGLAALGPGPVLAALAIGAATTVCSAGRWTVVARGLGLRLPFPAAVADYYRALLLNSVLPTGVLGDVHRAFRHGRRVGATGRAARAVLLERLAGQAVLIGAAPLVLPTAAPAVAAVLGRAEPPGPAGTAVLAGAAVVAGGALVWAVSGGHGRRLARTGAAVVREARAVACAPRIWLGVLGLSAVALAGYLALFVVAARAVGAQAPVPVLLPVLVAALMAMSVPVGFGGWGPRESAAAVGFAAVGLDAAQGFGAAVAYGLLALVSTLPGAGVLLADRLRDRHPHGHGDRHSNPYRHRRRSEDSAREGTRETAGEQPSAPTRRS